MVFSSRHPLSPWLRVLKRLKYVALAFLLIGIGGALYLSQFSLPLTFLKPAVVSYGQKMGVPLNSIDISLVWRKWNQPVELRLKNLQTTFDVENRPLTIHIPRAYLTLHWGQLLKGNLEIKAVALSQPSFSRGGGDSTSFPPTNYIQAFFKELFSSHRLPAFTNLSVENPFPTLWPNLLLKVERQEESLVVHMKDKNGGLLKGLFSYQPTNTTVQIKVTLENLTLPPSLYPGQEAYLKKFPPLSGIFTGGMALDTPYQAGTFLLKGQTKDPTFFEEFSLAGKWDSDVFTLSEGKIKQSDVTALLHGAWQKNDDLSESTNIWIRASTDAVSLDKLSHLWPADLAPSAREWIVQNLKDGEITSSALHFSLTLGKDSTILSNALEGSLNLRGVTVNYLDGMPPVTHVEGTAAFTEKAFDIHLTSGTLQAQKLVKGNVWITGLDLPDQHLKTDLLLKGPLPDILDILSHPPLMYTQKIDVPLESIKGTIDTSLTLSFPLENDLKFEHVTLKAIGHLKQFAYDFPLPAPAKPLRFEKGDLLLSVTPQRMELKGKALLHKEPVRILWKESFDNVTSRELIFEALMTPLGLQTWKIDLGDSLKGSFPFKFFYTPHGKLPLRFEADLTPTTLKISLLNWEKKSGISAQLTGSIKKHPRGTQIEALTLKASDMSFQGNIFLSPTYALDKFTFSEIKSPRNDCSLNFEHTQGGTALTLRGKAADIGAFMAPGKEGSSDNLLADKTNFHALFDLAKIYVGTEDPLYDFKGSLSGIQKGPNFEILRADLKGKSSPLIPTPSAKPRTGDFSLSIQKLTPENQFFSLRSANGGYLLKALGLVLNVRGGTLSITGSRKQPAAPLQGKISLEDFTIAKTPFLTQLLMTLASPTSFLGLFSNGKIDFSQFNCNFTWKEPLFIIKDGLFQSLSSGISLDGKINLKTKTLDMRGNLIPLYAVNKGISAIPLIGMILGGGEGDGIGATRFFVKGTVDQPNVSVNPIQIIAPGIIKKLLSAFSSDADEKSEP